MGWVEVVSESSGPLFARSALASKGRVAKTISILLEASFSAGGSLVAVGALRGIRGHSLV